MRYFIGDDNVRFLHQRFGTDTNCFAIDVRPDTPTCDGFEILRAAQLTVSQFRVIHNRLAQGMLRAALGTGRVMNQILFSNTVKNLYVGNARRALGDGAGLIQHDSCDILHALDGSSFSDEHTVLGAHAGSDHQRGRRGESECTWTGDDQHRDGGVKRQRNSAHVRIHPRDKSSCPFGYSAKKTGKNQPGCQCQQRYTNDHRHEHAGNPVGELLDRHLGALRLFHHPDDLAQEGLLADLSGADFQYPVLINRRANNLIIFGLFDGHGFAGGQRLVHTAKAVDNHAIGGNLFAGTHNHDVALLQLPDRNTVFFSIVLDTGLFSLKGEQLFNRLGGASLGLGLHVASCKMKRHDHSGDAGEAVKRRTDAELVQERDESRCQRRQRTHGDEHVHIRRQVSCGLPCASNRLPAGIKDRHG
ncbi:MAG: hypothetical protein MAGBODY4_00849 [Candidatus Marinimicrobia bacterium]|nr:hypothetical protein [Candidatus Neomarinimicrobiota bacterium]